MASVPQEALEQIWNQSDGHVPSIHTDWWEQLLPNNFRSEAIRSSAAPVPIGEFRQLPWKFLQLSPLKQLLTAGQALLEAVFDPALHLSLVGKQLFYASGVTILLIESRRDGEIAICPWSQGESHREVLRRLVRTRLAPQPKLTSQEAFIAANVLPRAQACLSVVSQFGIEMPQTNILASGGECPISVTVGSKFIHFVLDHRCYDSDTASILYERFFRFLAELL